MNRVPAVVRCALLSVLVPCGLRAQAGAPTIEPATPPLLRLRVAAIDQLGELLAAQHVYPLLEDYGLVDALRGRFVGFAATVERSRTIRAEAVRCGVQLESYQLGNVIRLAIVEGLFHAIGRPGARQVEMQTHMSSDPMGSSQVAILSCTPRESGRWAQSIEQEIGWWRSCGWFEEKKGLELDALPAPAFVVPGGGPGAGASCWFVSLPGAFVIGSGSPDEIAAVGRVELAPEALSPGLHYEVDFWSLDKQAQGMQMAELELIAKSGIRGVDFRIRPDGDRIREEIELRLLEGVGGGGLADVLLAAEGALAPQALPDGAMLQLRARLALRPLVEFVQGIGQLDALPARMLEALPDVLDGAVTLGVCAPAPGGVIPRVYLTLGMKQGDAFGKLVADLGRQGMPDKQVVYDDITCHVVELEGVPMGLQPTWCVVDGLLHVAESPLGMRALLRAQRDGVATMQLSEPLVPDDVPGEPFSNLELRFEPATAYRAFYDVWQPLLRLAAAAMSGGSGSPGGMSRDELPEPRDAAAYARPVQAAFFRDGQRLGMHAVGALGGVVTTGYVVVLSQFADELASGPGSRLHAPLAEHKLREVGKALARFEQREGRAPVDLAELFVAERLDDRALWIPGDPIAETLDLSGGRKVQVSFRYFPEPVDVEVFGRARKARLIGRERGSGRTMLDVHGETSTLYGEERERAIEDFGNGD